MLSVDVTDDVRITLNHSDPLFLRTLGIGMEVGVAAGLMAAGVSPVALTIQTEGIELIRKVAMQLGYRTVIGSPQAGRISITCLPGRERPSLRIVQP